MRRKSFYHSSYVRLSILLIIGLLFRNEITAITSFVISPFLADAQDASMDEVISPSVQATHKILELQKKAELYDDLFSLFVRGTSTAPYDGHHLVTIIGRSELSPYGTIVIGAGSQDGVSKGRRIYFEGKTLYGTVEKVTASTATVVPFARSGRKLKAYVRGVSPITLIGRGSGSFEFTTPEQNNVQIGDLIYAGNGAVLAEVVEVSRREDTTLSSVLARTPYSINSFKFLTLEQP
jgi:hypothetical protein